MRRKSPIKHDVSDHYRDGKWVEHYERGHGDRPEFERRHTPTVSPRGSSVYNVVFTFPDGSTESYNGGGSATGALKEAIGRIQRPVLPRRAALTLVGGK